MTEHAEKHYDISSLLNPLFEKARLSDVFEFGCTLMRIKEFRTIPDPMFESNKLLQQVALLIQAPLEPSLKIRLTLFLYCHATEMDEMYNVICNLLRVSAGERYAGEPFWELNEKLGRPPGPHHKIEKLISQLTTQGFAEIAEMIEFMFVKQVRDAFFHSDYALFDKEFIIEHGKGIVINGVLTTAIPLVWLMPRLETGINLALSTTNLIFESIASFKEEKIVPARILPDDGIEHMLLMVDPKQGLKGFRGLDEAEKKKYGLI